MKLPQDTQLYQRDTRCSVCDGRTVDARTDETRLRHRHFESGSTAVFCFGLRLRERSKLQPNTAPGDQSVRTFLSHRVQSPFALPARSQLRPTLVPGENSRANTKLAKSFPNSAPNTAKSLGSGHSATCRAGPRTPHPHRAEPGLAAPCVSSGASMTTICGSRGCACI